MKAGDVKLVPHWTSAPVLNGPGPLKLLPIEASSEEIGRAGSILKEEERLQIRGYAGLPLEVAFAPKHQVVGFDVNFRRARRRNFRRLSIGVDRPVNRRAITSLAQQAAEQLSASGVVASFSFP